MKVKQLIGILSGLGREDDIVSVELWAPTADQDGGKILNATWTVEISSTGREVELSSQYYSIVFCIDEGQNED